MAEKRARWHEDLAAESVSRLVFVDESGANTKMTRLRGRALAGRRLVAHVPHGSYQTSTLVSGMRVQGPCAPWLFQGPMNGEMFLAWVTQGLAPTLQEGDVVILDNLATHKVRGIREAIEASGARLLYLPPYSPDFNPIEPMWSKVKQILRRHAPRTENALLLASQTAFQAISPADCQGYFLAPSTLYDLWKRSRPDFLRNRSFSQQALLQSMPNQESGIKPARIEKMDLRFGPS